MSTNLVAGAIDVIKDTIVKLGNYKKLAKTNSLLEVTKVARVEPLCFLDTDCLNHSATTDIIWSAQSIFSGYYLQSVSLLGTTLNGIDIAKKLDPLNPNRSLAMLSYSAEDFKYKLPSYANHDISMENNISDAYRQGTGDASITANYSQFDITQSLHENQTLSLGKVYNVTIADDSNRAVIPISIRLVVNTVPSNQIVDILTHTQTHEYDLKERWHSYTSGELSFWKDLVFCNDLIKKHRKQLIKDKNGAFTNISRRDALSTIAAFTTGTPSLASASNIAIISSETAKQIEYKMNGKLSKMDIRDQVFENTNLMILIVFDKNWERLTYYYRGIAEHSEASVNQIKTGNKQDHTLEFVKAFLQGSAAPL